MAADHGGALPGVQRGAAEDDAVELGEVVGGPFGGAVLGGAGEVDLGAGFELGEGGGEGLGAGASGAVAAAGAGVWGLAFGDEQLDAVRHSGGMGARRALTSAQR